MMSREILLNNQPLRKTRIFFSAIALAVTLVHTGSFNALGAAAWVTFTWQKTAV
jgi:hypothetical protein